jgi:hypothetical protein
MASCSVARSALRSPSICIAPFIGIRKKSPYHEDTGVPDTAATLCLWQ